MADRAPLETAEVMCRDVARLLKGACPKGWGFFLVLADFSGPGEGFKTYMSSMEREGAISLLREMADTLEHGENPV
jgi:hypothetical protein